MKRKIRFFFSFLILLLISERQILKAQSSREGNHCAVAKSPYHLSMDSGKIVYTRECVSCHQSDGGGVVTKNPALTGKFVSGDKKHLIQILVGEHASSFERKGNESTYEVYRNPVMSDSEIANVLTFIRNSFGNKASSVKISEVKTVRNQ
jgi:mono/diheme cytochrome c family protein